jgi:hypothetical protein
MFDPTGTLTPTPFVVHPVASPYTEYSTPAPHIIIIIIIIIIYLNCKWGLPVAVVLQYTNSHITPRSN